MSQQLKHIAAELKVSVSTVSRALSGKPGVSEKKRARIVEFAKRFGYSPNVYASSLRTGCKQGLTVITSYIVSEIASIRNTMLFQAGKEEFGTIRVVSLSNGDDLDSVIRDAIAQGSQGIILSHLNACPSTQAKEIAENNQVPMVSIDLFCEGIDNVLLDRSNGAYQAARMLLLSGCKAPVFYSNCSVEEPDNRMIGIIKAFESVGKSRDDIKIVRVKGADFTEAYSITEELINSQVVDGIFTYNDALAVGTLRCLYQQGIRVPEQIKVVGFDNLPVSGNLPISLTTVAQPMADLVHRAIDLIKSRLADRDKPPVTVSFKSSLIARETAPIDNHELRQEVFQELSE